MLNNICRYFKYVGWRRGCSDLTEMSDVGEMSEPIADSRGRSPSAQACRQETSLSINKYKMSKNRREREMLELLHYVSSKMKIKTFRDSLTPVGATHGNSVLFKPTQLSVKFNENSFSHEVSMILDSDLWFILYATLCKAPFKSSLQYS